MIRIAAVTALTLALAACAGQDAPIKPPPATATLTGGPWLAEDVNGGGVPDNAGIEMSFEAARVSGRSGCNRFSGPFTQTGTTVSFGALAGTRMMCPPAQMDIEGRVLGVLGAATSVSFDATGAAVLNAPDGRSIKLRRASR